MLGLEGKAGREADRPTRVVSAAMDAAVCCGKAECKVQSAFLPSPLVTWPGYLFTWVFIYLGINLGIYLGINFHQRWLASASEVRVLLWGRPGARFGNASVPT